MAVMRFGSYTDDPVKNVYELLGTEYTDKLAAKYPTLKPRQRVMFILKRLWKKNIRHHNIIVYRTGLAKGHDGKIYSFTEIAAANKLSRSTAHQYFCKAVILLKKLIDE